MTSTPAWPQTEDVLGIHAELRLSMGGQDMAGARHVQLLREIAKLGSITQAAKATGFSYKGAWNAIEHMSNLAGTPLLERVAGGKTGGYSRLTPRGMQLVANFGLIEHEHAQFVQRLNRQSQGLGADYSLLESIAMKTSARNQFAGTVQALVPGAVNDEVVLDVIGGQRLVATVTRESCHDLGLRVGAKAFAIVQASSVLLLDRLNGVKVSARNQLHGRVERIQNGAVNTEVVLALAGGGTVAALVTQASAQEMGLEVGVPAIAVFKASSVILAVAA